MGQVEVERHAAQANPHKTHYQGTAKHESHARKLIRRCFPMGRL